MPKKPSPMSCPKGHAIPHKGQFGQCSPIYCGEETLSADGGSALAKAPKSSRAIAHASLDTPEAKEQRALHRAMQRLATRHDLVSVPKGLTGQDAEDWADKRLVELLPAAVAEIEFQLKYGDDGQREKAADKVLNATGRGKREALNGGGATIILVGAQNGQMPVPWARRIEDKAKTLVASSDKEDSSS